MLNQDGSGTWLNKVAGPSGEYDVFDLVGNDVQCPQHPDA